jgi:hypothetical protein
MGAAGQRKFDRNLNSSPIDDWIEPQKLSGQQAWPGRHPSVVQMSHHSLEFNRAEIVAGVSAWPLGLAWGSKLLMARPNA